MSRYRRITVPDGMPGRDQWTSELISELWYDDAHLAHALRTLGRIYERRGDEASARAIYSRLATLYENAEPAFRPVYDEARSALARLTVRDG